MLCFFFFQAEDGIRDVAVTGVQTCALPISRESLMRHTLALFSLPIVTSNGKVRSVDNPRGNALEYLCGFNDKASTLDMHIRDLKYLQISNLLIETTAKFWIDFWNSRTKFDNIFACYYIDGNTKALWSSKP